MSFSDVSGASKYFVTPNEGFSTTTSGTTASGATTVGLNSVSGLTNGTTFVGVIEPAGTKEQIFTGVVDTSGSQITGVVWTKGSNIDHATGVSVVDYDTGTALKLMTTGIKKEHNDSGTHSAVTATSVVATGALTGTSLVNAIHTHANNAGGGLLVLPYGFSAYSTAAQNTGNGAYAQTLFATEEYDIGSNFASSTFTAPVTGYYHFDARVGTSATLSTLIIALYKNGAVWKLGNDLRTSAAVQAATISIDVRLTAADTVDVRTLGNATTAIDVTQSACYFMGRFIGT